MQPHRFVRNTAHAWLLLAVAMFLSIGSTTAMASTFTGSIQGVIVAPSPYVNGNVRVSVHITSGSTSCPNYTWYAFEYSPATGNIGQAWTAALFAAQVSNTTVEISGTGTCDQASVETVAGVTLSPPSS